MIVTIYWYNWEVSRHFHVLNFLIRLFWHDITTHWKESCAKADDRRWAVKSCRSEPMIGSGAVGGLKREVYEAPGDVKLLGFWLDPTLSWSSHVEHVCIRLSRVLFLLRRLKTVVNDQFLITVYHSLFHSHINYGIVLWGHAPSCNKVLLLQKKALRIITSSGHQEPCRSIFKQLNILTVFGQYLYNSLTTIHNQFSSLQSRGDVHNHNTRSSSTIDIPRCRLSKTLNSYPVAAMRRFNDLPVSLRNLDSNKFRSTLKALLISRPIYSLSEFQGIWGSCHHHQVL